MRYIIICGFAGIGKTYFGKTTNLNVIDLDSSQFSRTDFPNNYVKYVKQLIGENIVMISTHKQVREALAKQNINFYLIYPSKDQKEDYINRYINRGSDISLIEMIQKNFDIWIEELQQQKGCTHIMLKKGEFLGDVIYDQIINK